MSQSEQEEDVAAQTARLEAALERIAALAGPARQGHPAETSASASSSVEAPLLAEITTRLDNTIARLRAAIGER